MNGIPRLTYQQYRAVRRLVHDCCNYDGGNCLALDDGWEPCVCVQSITYSLVCKWFRAAVLPTDKGLCAALLHRGQARPCAECGAMFVPRSNRGKYCDECAANVRRRKKAASERERRRRGHLEAEKPCNQDRSHSISDCPQVWPVQQCLIYLALLNMISVFIYPSNEPPILVHHVALITKPIYRLITQGNIGNR